MPRVSGGDPRSAGAPAIRQPAHEGGLARVLEVVVDHADQADAERDGRVPALVDDPVEVGGSSPRR